jgi:hypothetical protein
MDPGFLFLAFLFFAGKRGGGGTSSTSQSSQTGADLLRRANAAQAAAWFDTFMSVPGTTADQARAYARWAGIESSGDPLAISPIGERGLFQITRTTAKGTVTTQEWEAMIRPTTSREEHARMALAQLAIYWWRAQRLIKNVPSDDASVIWYAKMWHSQPADFNGKIMHGSALAMARQLASTWSSDPDRMYRLRVANVIAFGDPKP